MIQLEARFNDALSYEAFLNEYGTPEHRRRWAEVHDRFSLTDAQSDLLATFVRDMNVLCLAGAWCGDCVDQCPILEHFATVCSRIHLRFVDRDATQELAEELLLCGGKRVPIVLFLSEDFLECGRYGDRTLARYRALASELSGPAGVAGRARATNGLTAVADDWLREFERVHLMLRLSPRLRARHGD